MALKEGMRAYRDHREPSRIEQGKIASPEDISREERVLREIFFRELAFTPQRKCRQRIREF